jgi:hypothetical protein
MSQVNPEVDAKHTIASFRDAAEKHTTIEKVWDEMAKESKAFGHGTSQDKKYFQLVSDGLKSQGLLPELTVAYAQWHKTKMADDDGNLGKNRIDDWADLRKLQNGRLCEVEQTLINNLVGSYDQMKKIGAAKEWDGDQKGLTDADLSGVNAEFSKSRHANEEKAAHVAQENQAAAALKHGLLDPREDNQTVLFDKLSKMNGGRSISIASIEDAETFDQNQRNRQYEPGKPWHSYLNYQDKTAILNLESHFNEIAPVVDKGRSGDGHPSDKITMADIDNYLAKHSVKR